MVRNSTPPPPDNTAIVLTGAGTLRGVRRLLPIALFVMPFGTAFSLAAAQHGMTTSQSIAMSVLVFSGAAQFATLNFWHDPIAFGSLAFVLFTVNARNIVMGAALSPWVNQLRPAQRLQALSLLTGPNFADSQVSFKAGERDVGRLLGGGLVLWANWIVGAAFGACAGAWIGAPATYGLDVVMVCFFASIVMGQIRETTAILPGIIAAVVAVATLHSLPAGWNVIAAAIAGGIARVAFHAE